MRDRKLICIVVLAILFVSTPVQSQNRDDPVDFNVGDKGHVLTVIAEAPLVWQEDDQTLVTLNLTMTQFPNDNQSKIVISYIQFFAIETGTPQPELIGSNTTGVTLNTVNNSVLVESYLPPSTAGDRFYMNITIGASAIGAGVEQKVENYTFRFPSDTTIIVERDNLVPLINLYGFPPGSYFSIWLPIYLVTVFLFGLPAIVFGVDKVVTVLTKEEEKSNTKPEDSTDSEPEHDSPKTEDE